MSFMNMKYNFEIGSFSLEKVLFRLDLKEMYSQMEKIFNFHGNQYYIGKSMLMLTFGFFKDAFKYLEKRKSVDPSFDLLEYDSSLFTNDKLTTKDLMARNSPLLNPFIKHSFINHEILELILLSDWDKVKFEGEMAQLAIYPKINYIYQRANKQYIPSRRNMRTDLADWAEKFLKTFVAMPKSIYILTSFGLYNDAIAQSLVSEGGSVNSMMNYAINATMFNDSIKPFLREFHKVDPNEKMTKETWEGLLEEASKREMHLVRFELYLSRGDRIAAAHEALDEFKSTKKTLLQFIFIGNAYNCLIEAQHMEKEEIVNSDSFQQLFLLTKLQKEICSKMHWNHIQSCPDIINNPNSVVDACVILLELD